MEMESLMLPLEVWEGLRCSGETRPILTYKHSLLKIHIPLESLCAAVPVSQRHHLTCPFRVVLLGFRQLCMSHWACLKLETNHFLMIALLKLATYCWIPALQSPTHKHRLTP